MAEKDFNVATPEILAERDRLCFLEEGDKEVGVMRIIQGKDGSFRMRCAFSEYAEMGNLSRVQEMVMMARHFINNVYFSKPPVTKMNGHEDTPKSVSEELNSGTF